MTQLPVGLIALIIVSVLIYFGLAHRVLDRLKLSDRGAFIIIAVLIVGSFITIPITQGRYDVSLNVGGGLVPIVLAGYLLYNADSAKERLRAIIAAIATAVVIYGGGALFGGDAEPGGRFLGYIDTLWAYPLIAGIVAYLLGRSRRAAFVAATLGIVLLDIANLVWLTTTGAPAGTVAIGGAGAFDAIVLAGIAAVLLAEIVGEVRERIQGGPSSNRPEGMMQALRKPVASKDEEKERRNNEEDSKGGSPE